jgi:hypothetical protein
VGTEAGKEAGLLVVRVNVWPGGLAGAGVPVLTTSAVPGKDGVQSGISTVFGLASSGVAPGPCAGVGSEDGKEAGPAAGRVNVWPGGLAGAGVAVLTTSSVPCKDSAQSGFGMVFGLTSTGVAPGPGAGDVVLTTSAGPGKDGVQSGISTVFGLARSGLAPGSGAGVGREAGKDAGPAAGRVKVRQGSLVTQLEATTVLFSRALLNHSNLAFFSLWTSGVIG